MLNAFRSYNCYDDLFDDQQGQIARTSYFGLCSFVDDLIGDMLTALDQSGRLEATGFGETQEDQALPGQSLFQTAAAADDPRRAVFSEYHDGGSITGYMMLREGRWKYIASAGFAPPLFDLESDPFEEKDLGLSDGRRDIREHLHTRMCREFGDFQTISNQAFADQADRIEALGGIDSIYARDNFDHTPVETETGD